MTIQERGGLGQGVLPGRGGGGEGEGEVPGQVDAVGVVVDCRLVTAV